MTFKKYFIINIFIHDVTETFKLIINYIYAKLYKLFIELVKNCSKMHLIIRTLVGCGSESERGKMTIYIVKEEKII